MLASVHSAINGWSVVIALLILLAAIVLEKVVPPLPWVAWTTLFLVAMFGLTLCVHW